MRTMHATRVKQAGHATKLYEWVCQICRGVNAGICFPDDQQVVDRCTDPNKMHHPLCNEEVNIVL